MISHHDWSSQLRQCSPTDTHQGKQMKAVINSKFVVKIWRKYLTHIRQND